LYGNPSGWVGTAEEPSSDLPASTATPADTDACPRGFVTREGDKLVMDGQPLAFFGVNAPFLVDASFPADQVEPVIADLAARGVNTVRVWFFADDDPERLQTALDLGARHGIRFVVVLGDNVNKGVDWFFGDDDEQVYRPHLLRTVQRFAARPEVLAWEPMNEPNCGEKYGDACLKTLRDWLVMASRLVVGVDPCHLVSSGLIGAGNYDADRQFYRRVHDRDSIPLLSLHRRSTDAESMELTVAADLDKPLYAGEIYDEAYDEGCRALDGGAELDRRAERVKDDFREALDDGVDGYLLWDYAPGRVRGGDVAHDYCSKFGYERDDPLWRKLAETGMVPPVPWRAQP
jgi:hypothetical protein